MIISKILKYWHTKQSWRSDYKEWSGFENDQMSMHTQHILCNEKQIKKRSLCSFQAQICALFSMRCFYWNFKPKAKRISWRSNTFHETRHEYERASSFHCALYLCWKWTAINTLGAAQQQQQQQQQWRYSHGMAWVHDNNVRIAGIHKRHQNTQNTSFHKCKLPIEVCILHTAHSYSKHKITIWMLWMNSVDWSVLHIFALAFSHVYHSN